MSGEPGRRWRWRRILVWGTAWGIAITVVMLLWWLTDWLTPLWCLVGCLFVWVADRAARQHNIRVSLVGWLTVALTSAIAQPFLENRLQAWIGEVLPAAVGLTMRAAVRMSRSSSASLTRRMASSALRTSTTSSGGATPVRARWTGRSRAGAIAMNATRAARAGRWGSRPRR